VVSRPIDFKERKIVEYTVAFIFKEITKYEDATPLFEVLLMKKLKGPYPNCLNGVGGKLEYNEQPSLGMLREIKEETGLQEENFKTFAILLDITFKNGNILHVYFALLKDDCDFKQIEDEPLAWYPVDGFDSVSDTSLAGDGNIPYFINLSKQYITPKNPIVRDDNGTVIIYCPNKSCNAYMYGNVWVYESCPQCGQMTNKY
jgi:8-oxo-dGTP diphosphatase